MKSVIKSKGRAKEPRTRVTAPRVSATPVRLSWAPVAMVRIQDAGTLAEFASHLVELGDGMASASLVLRTLRMTHLYDRRELRDHAKRGGEDFGLGSRGK